MTALLPESRVARLLNVSRWTVMRLRKEGRLAYVMVGRTPKYREQDVLAYIESQREPVVVMAFPTRRRASR